MTPLSRELQSLIEANKTLDDSIASAKSVEATYDDAVNEFMASLWIDLGEAGFRRIWREFNQLSEELLRSPEDRYRDAIETVRHARATAKGERMANVLRNAAIQSDRTTPRPGDRLTAAQLRDAPDGTVVQDWINPLAHYTKANDDWSDGITPFAHAELNGGHILVRWGCASADTSAPPIPASAPEPTYSVGDIISGKNLWDLPDRSRVALLRWPAGRFIEKHGDKWMWDEKSKMRLLVECTGVEDENEWKVVHIP